MWLTLPCSLLLLGVHCESASRPSAQARYDAIQRYFLSGNLEGAENEAQQAAAVVTDPVWAAKFRLQQAKVAIYRGDNRGGVSLLQGLLPADLSDPALGVIRSSLLALAYERLNDPPRSKRSLEDAASLCRDDASWAQLHLAQGIIDGETNRLEDAEQAFQQGLTSARASGDRFLQMQNAQGLAVVALRQDHYEDALKRFDDVSALARAIGARQALEKADGSAGKTLYRMGDLEGALRKTEDARSMAEQLGLRADEASWLSDASLTYYRQDKLDKSLSSAQQAYELAKSVHDNGAMVDALYGLAQISLRKGDLQGALNRAREAEQAARESGNTSTIFEPTLLEAQALLRQNQLPEARGRLQSMLANASGTEPRPFERWQIQSTLARVADAAGDKRAAADWSKQAIETFRSQRQVLNQTASQLSFGENGTGLYRDYMEQLLQEDKTTDALAVLDRSRAETLTDDPERPAQTGETWEKNPTAMARRLGGTILVYCLMRQASYLWAIAPNRSAFYRLPGSEVLRPLIDRHTGAVISAKDVLAQDGAPGAELYRDLIQPASDLIPHGGKVYLIADGDLNHLNFETLVAPGAQPHFWIEDADVVNAKSLALLASRPAGARSEQSGKELLLVGDPVYDRPEFPKLPNAAQEVSEVSRHFPGEQTTVLTGAQATRGAYLAGRPGDFRYIHFVAHATANELNPLDSAVVLSAQPGEPDAYRLYARDIIDRKIHADLVTISACYGSGVRTYSGEGLVGLAWAFLRAGSHNVVGALWEVSDASTPQLMGDLYDGLAQGRSPDAALRAAKLKMLAQGNVFRKPFYWAAFQLYSGS